MRKIRLAILKNKLPDEHLLWIKAFENYLDIIEYDIIDLTATDWYDKIIKKKYDYSSAFTGFLSAV